ncbi:MAG: hypothetical protein CM1200mP15_17480 [Dehalococcoidia bacterium]|nr:MAG: hypothetical protein CM1200mP15_17480 [Dehalococcoidia bacterium]
MVVMVLLPFCNILGVNVTCSGTVSTAGMGDITATIPNVPSGVQKFYLIDADSTSLKTNITIGSATITSTPPIIWFLTRE